MESSESKPADQLKATGERESVPDEHIWEGNYSGKAMIGGWVLAGVISVALIVGIVFSLAIPFLPIVLGAAIAAVWVWLLGLLAYRKLSVHYELTTHRFNHEKGILKRTNDRIETIDIDDVTYEQGIIQRMFNVGTVRITSSDRTHPELVLIGIDDVARVADLIDDARRQERDRRGLHIEHI